MGGVAAQGMDPGPDGDPAAVQPDERVLPFARSRISRRPVVPFGLAAHANNINPVTFSPIFR